MSIERLYEEIGYQSRKDVSDVIYEKISRMITAGELEEGYVFPNESELCARLQVGRTSLREAYKALELSGYISRTKRGTRVNGKAQILSATPLMAIVNASSEKDFNEFRIVQESQCAYIAAQKATLDDVNQLCEINAALKTAYEHKDMEKMAGCDIEFHLTIGTMCRNTLVSAMVHVIYDRLKGSITENFRKALDSKTDVIAVTIQQHEGIIDAIRSRDMDLASKRMAEHIHTAISQFSSAE